MKQDFTGHCGETPQQKVERMHEYSISLDTLSNAPIQGKISDVPTKFKEWRLHRKLTLRQVEKVTGISNSYLSQLENGKVEKPSFDVAIKLLIVYRVKISI